MRILLAVVFVALPGLTFAQSRDGSSLPPIGLPLAHIGLPLAPIGLAPATPTSTTSPRQAPRRDHRGERPNGHARPNVVYVVPYYGYGPGIAMPSPEPTPAPTAAPAAPPVATTGVLTLDLPRHERAQVFVDGVFVGAVAEAAELELPAGTHDLEIRDAGFAALALRVRIDPGRSISYRGALQALAAPAATGRTAEPPAPPIVRKPFYYIPGCYLGDVPPQDAGLPPTCDPRNAVIVKPEAGSIRERDR